MNDYINFCIECIQTNLKDLKSSRNTAAKKAAANEIKFYCNEILARL